jgi:hypothetical protein
MVGALDVLLVVLAFDLWPPLSTQRAHAVVPSATRPRSRTSRDRHNEVTS